MQNNFKSVKASGKHSQSKTGATPRTAANVRSKRSPERQNSRPVMSKVEEVQAKQKRSGVVGMIYDFPQQGYLLLLFGVLAIGGSIAALCFKIDAPMFVQILGLVGAGCGIRIGADTVKYFNRGTKAGSKPND